MNHIKNLIALSAMLAATNSKAMGEQPGLKPADVDKSQLAVRVKNDLYKILIQEMGLLNPNWNEMAHGNADQAKDLEKIYKSNTVSEAQQKLDAFCKKWKFERAIIGK